MRMANGIIVSNFVQLDETYVTLATAHGKEMSLTGESQAALGMPRVD